VKKTTLPAPAPRRRYATIADTAAYMDVTGRTVREMFADGRLTKYTLGPRIVRADLNQVDAMMEQSA
jgi:excisionase family DNA binding protein